RLDRLRIQARHHHRRRPFLVQALRGAQGGGITLSAKDASMANIGFIGLGIMGAPMAGHLVAGGHKLLTCIHKSPVPADLASKGVATLATPKAVAEKSDIIILMVPDTPQVEQVLFGENGVAKGLSKGKTVIDMSSIAPLATKEFAKKINALGCDYVDAPVSGGEVGAK